MKKTTYKIVVSGLLIAISIVLTRLFSFTFPVLNFPASRLSIGFVPIILAGILLGPVWGIAVGALADAIGFVISSAGQSLPYSPLITVVSALVGLLSFFVYYIFIKIPKGLRISLTISITLIICSMFLQPMALSQLTGIPYWAMFSGRLLVNLVSIPVYCVLIYYIIRGLERARLLPAQPATHRKE
jgi:riboflavin transporter